MFYTELSISLSLCDGYVDLLLQNLPLLASNKWVFGLLTDLCVVVSQFVVVAYDNS